VPTPAGTATTLVGALLIVLGLDLLAETAWFWHTHTATEEPASPGRTPNPSKRREEEREFREAIEEGRRDVLRLRIRLYGCVPGGLLIILIGSWLMTARPRERQV